MNTMPEDMPAPEEMPTQETPTPELAPPELPPEVLNQSTSKPQYSPTTMAALLILLVAMPVSIALLNRPTRLDSSAQTPQPTPNPEQAAIIQHFMHTDSTALLKNPSFETLQTDSQAQNWQSSSPDSNQISQDEHADGTKSYKFSPVAANSSSKISQTIAGHWTAQTRLYVSGAAKSASSTLTNKAQINVTAHYADNTTQTFRLKFTGNAANNWTTSVGSFVLPKDAQTLIVKVAADQTSGNIFIDDLYLGDQTPTNTSDISELNPEMTTVDDL